MRRSPFSVPCSLLPVFVLALTGCRGEPPDPSGERELGRMVDSLVPIVEQSVGLTFRSRPRYALRTPDEVRAFIVRKLAQDMPPERFRHVAKAYTLLGLLPDSLDLRAVMEEVFAQQIAGYYDPDSAMLYGRAGATGPVLRLTIAHELVHALQDQYLPLDSIVKDKSSADRSAAAQAILEGQATYATIVMLQGAEVAARPEFWEEARKTGDGMLAGGELGKVPAVLREGLLFPYLGGADFMRWWAGSRFKDTLPYGPRMPRSTEQILHPERYQSGDEPARLSFADTVPGAYEDVLGEFDIRLLVQELTGRSATRNVLPLGWGGDRFRLDEANGAAGLVWITVWDEPRHRDRFLAQLGDAMRARAAKGYRVALDTMTVGQRSGFRYAVGDSAWRGWASLPSATLSTPEARKS
jgi:hypothetical protein